MLNQMLNISTEISQKIEYWYIKKAVSSMLCKYIFRPHSPCVSASSPHPHLRHRPAPAQVSPTILGVRCGPSDTPYEERREKKKKYVSLNLTLHTVTQKSKQLREK